MDVEVAEALYHLGRLEPGQLQEVGLGLLRANYHGPAILELAEHPYATWRDVPGGRGLVDRAFAETGRPPLSDGDAGMRLVRGIAGRIVSGAIDPAAGTRKLLEIWNYEEWGWGYELGTFAGLEDYLEQPEYRDWAKQGVIEKARDLLDKIGPTTRP